MKKTVLEIATTLLFITIVLALIVSGQGNILLALAIILFIVVAVDIVRPSEGKRGH